MTRISCRLIIVLLFIGTLCACGGRVQSVDTLASTSMNDFMYAMRWKQYQVAAAFLQQREDQEYVLKTFRDLRDLHVTDVRLIDMKRVENGKRFQTTMEMDYYLPPSVTLTTFTFDLTWVYFGNEDTPVRGVQIVSPFPEFP